MKTQSGKKKYSIYRSVSSSRLNKSVGVDVANFSCKIQIIKIEDKIYIKLKQLGEASVQNKFFPIADNYIY